MLVGSRSHGSSVPEHVTVNHLGDVVSGPGKGGKIQGAAHQKTEGEESIKPRPAVAGSASGKTPGGGAGALATMFNMLPQEQSKRKGKQRPQNPGLKRKN